MENYANTIKWGIINAQPDSANFIDEYICY